jgi:acetyl esterase/lipase
MSSPVEEAHFIVLPGGGYATHAENKGKPIADCLAELGIRATVLRYPLNARRPVPLDAVRCEVRRLRATGTARVGVIGFSAGGHLAGQATLSDARCGAGNQRLLPLETVLSGRRHWRSFVCRVCEDSPE